MKKKEKVAKKGKAYQPRFTFKERKKERIEISLGSTWEKKCEDFLLYFDSFGR